VLRVHVNFGSSVSKDVLINRREISILEIAGALPPCGGRVADPKICPPTRVILLNLVVLGQTVCVIKEIHLKNLTPHIPPFNVTKALKVIGSDIDRSSTHDLPFIVPQQP